MSLVVNPQPDGSLIVSCGDDKVVIPAPGSPARIVSVPPPPDPPIPGDGVVIVQLGPGPAASVRLEAADLESIVDALPDDLAIVPVELRTWPEEGIDVQALMSATRERLGPDVSIDLHFLNRDE